MPDEANRRVARVDKQEFKEMPASWSDEERGQYLRRLLRCKGIDPGRLFRIEYYPHRLCWLIHQQPMHSAPAAPAALQGDGAFFTQVMAEFRRTARTAFASVAAHSLHFASHGCNYQLPPEPEEISTADLVDELGDVGDDGSGVRFDNEGGWQAKQSEN